MLKSAYRVNLAITPGEPAGIGPDVALILASQQLNPKQERPQHRLLLIADPDLLEQRARLLGLKNLRFNQVQNADNLTNEAVNVLPVKLGSQVNPGELNPDNAAYVLETLEVAVKLCESDQCQAVVTGPVHKANINEAGINFTGHTEWLANRTATKQVVMMLATPDLRVALATTHLPLRQVADAIQPATLLGTIKILHGDLQNRFAIRNPTILVCGLNPHAGENGHMGHEEIDTIIPTLAQAKKQGINVIGPVPADTAFTPGNLAAVDAVLAMYHDQGLPVLKHQGFGDAVNITLGLPIIRTSVDHGTALDLAASGKALPGSLITAVKYATEMVQHKLTNIDH